MWSCRRAPGWHAHAVGGRALDGVDGATRSAVAGPAVRDVVSARTPLAPLYATRAVQGGAA